MGKNRFFGLDGSGYRHKKPFIVQGTIYQIFQPKSRNQHLVYDHYRFSILLHECVKVKVQNELSTLMVTLSIPAVRRVDGVTLSDLGIILQNKFSTLTSTLPHTDFNNGTNAILLR